MYWENFSIVTLLLISFGFLSSTKNGALVDGQVVSIGLCPRPPPMKNFDIFKYFGKWYEVEKYFFAIEAGSSCVTVEYFDQGDQDKFGVKITQNMAGRKVSNDGTTIFNSKDGSADLTLDLRITQNPVPFNYHYRYLVLDTDYETYTIKWACRNVGLISYQNMWILTRDGTFSDATQTHVYGKLRSLGINTRGLLKSDTSTCARTDIN